MLKRRGVGFVKLCLLDHFLFYSACMVLFIFFFFEILPRGGFLCT